MALSAAEEALVRELIAENPQLLSLADNEATIISKLGATKKNLSELAASLSLNDTDLAFVRQGASDKSVALSVLKTYAQSGIDLSLYLQKAGGTMTGAFNEAAGSDIASSATTNIGSATGNYVQITGTTTITSFGSGTAGSARELRFAASLTLTHNATSLILPTGANIITAAGDIARFRSEGGSNWRCVSYTRADGSSLFGQKMLLTASVATTSGTLIDITSIPSWAKRITVLFNGVSTNGINNYILQLGTSSGVETTGYSGYINAITGATVVTVASTAGAILSGSSGTATVVSGSIKIENQSGNNWQITGTTTRSAENTNNIIASNKSLAGVLDRIRITTTTAVDTFDAGSVSILIEGY